MKRIIEINDQLPSIDQVNETLRSNTAGAVAHFVGNIRESNNGRIVEYIDFEVYDAMAIDELARITERLFGEYAIESIIFYHKKGRVKPNESAVIAAVSAPHRKDAFEALMELMSALKKTVPIWKKEVYKDGHVWVSANP